MSHPNGATTSLKGHPTFLFQSTIRICFHERRLQYTEREQMLAWQRARPGERLLEVDVPLSYGMVDVCQPSPSNNSVEFMWDPTKEVGVYIKVQERDLQIKKEDQPQLQLFSFVSKRCSFHQMMTLLRFIKFLRLVTCTFNREKDF